MMGRERPKNRELNVMESDEEACMSKVLEIEKHTILMVGTYFIEIKGLLLHCPYIHLI